MIQTLNEKHFFRKSVFFICLFYEKSVFLQVEKWRKSVCLKEKYKLKLLIILRKDLIRY